jgi:predicted transcriptional regulator
MSQPVDLVELTADIVAAQVAGNKVSASELPDLIKSVHEALAGLGKAPEPVEPEKPKGAVSVRASIKPDGLISMIDGKKYQTLRRHINRHGYTPESYRETFGLPHDYPMTSASYSAARSEMAKSLGLGRKAVAATVVGAAVAAAAVVAAAPAKPARKPRVSKAGSPETGAAMALVETARKKTAVETVAPVEAQDAAPAPKRRGRPLKLKLGNAAEAKPVCDEFYDRAKV